MAEKTQIVWSEATWNVITGCTLVSEECRFCYAARLAATRLKHHPSRAGLAKLNKAGVAQFTGEVRFNEGWLEQPIRWKRPRRIFVCAHGDLFHEQVSKQWIDRVFDVIRRAPQHTYQILTKRPEYAEAYFRLEPQALGPNVWVGASVGTQHAAEDRIHYLLQIPAAVRWLSMEPLLERLDVSPWLDRLHWGVVGCESGPVRRPIPLAWVKALRDQFAAARVPFFIKQIEVRGEVRTDPAFFPPDLRIQQWPEAKETAA